MPRVLILILTCVWICAMSLRLTQSTPPFEDFDLEGTAVWQCQCVAHSCPCQKNGAPTHGTCEAADFVHIRSGHYGKVRLDGLNAVTIGNLVDQDQARIYATVYIDQNASESQRRALTAIEQFINGAYETSPLQGSAVKFVPIIFNESKEKTTYDVTIPGILEEQTRLRRDASGKPVSTETAMDSWANVEHYADNIRFGYHDKENQKTWDHSGGYANVKYFHLTKGMYDRKEMLGQYGDFSVIWECRVSVGLGHIQHDLVLVSKLPARLIGS